eukprot:SAG11_NODE_14577_length_607_cov_0.854331_1_plen_149_part_10
MQAESQEKRRMTQAWVDSLSCGSHMDAPPQSQRIMLGTCAASEDDAVPPPCVTRQVHGCAPGTDGAPGEELAALSAELKLHKEIIANFAEERKEWEIERQEIMEEMAGEARERHRLIEAANAERTRHRDERLQMLNHIESLMNQINAFE